MTRDEDYLGALIEDMDDRFEMILDLLDSMKDLPSDVKALKHEMSNVGQWKLDTQQLLKEHHQMLDRSNPRLAKLETV